MKFLIEKISPQIGHGSVAPLVDRDRRPCRLIGYITLRFSPHRWSLPLVAALRLGKNTSAVSPVPGKQQCE